ncbi:MAG: siphovirus Gp157 family protein [Acetivibrio ethanolgignens]
MNLYEINAAIMDCMQEVDEETGELLNVEMLDSLLLAKDEKIENIACWIKNLKADAEALKAEKDSFAKRQKAAENKVEQLKQYLSNVLEGEKFSSDKAAISFRKSEAVEIDDWTKLDKDYLKYKDPDVDKSAVKKALKSGCILNGVRLVEKQNIQIK